MRPVIKTARRGKDIKKTEVKNLTLDSTKNHLKIFKSYKITLTEAR